MQAQSRADRGERRSNGATSPRALTLLALRRWRTRNALADAILTQLLGSSDLIAQDRTFATELFYGILRNLSLLDFWIGLLRSGHLDPATRDLLRLGLYQVLVLDTAEHAAVYETVELAATKTRSLVNAVLRNALREKHDLLAKANEQNLDIRNSHPQFLIDRWIQNFGPDNTAGLCEWNNLPSPVYARINRLKISVQEFLSKYPIAERVPNSDTFIRLDSIPHDALVQGYCYIQDPATAVACELMDARPGERILDACAAPGGKTGYLAESMNNLGTIIACDREPSRIQTLQSNMKRLGATIVQCAQQDWIVHEQVSPIVSALPLDRILVDAPCSNTGVMRRRADLRWRLTPDDFLRMQTQQLRILRAVIPLLKTGGIIVYSTCSIEPEENEQVVESFKNVSNLKLVEQVTMLPFRDGFDGVFAAKLQREG